LCYEGLLGILAEVISGTRIKHGAVNCTLNYVCTVQPAAHPTAGLQRWLLLLVEYQPISLPKYYLAKLEGGGSGLDTSPFDAQPALPGTGWGPVALHMRGAAQEQC
jgi:hypothetical protein